MFGSTSQVNSPFCESGDDNVDFLPPMTDDNNFNVPIMAWENSVWQVALTAFRAWHCVSKGMENVPRCHGLSSKLCPARDIRAACLTRIMNLETICFKIPILVVSWNSFLQVLCVCWFHLRFSICLFCVPIPSEDLQSSCTWVLWKVSATIAIDGMWHGVATW